MEFQERKPGRPEPTARETMDYYSEDQDRSYAYGDRPQHQSTAWYNPKSWSRKVWIIVVVIAVIVIAIVIAVPVVVTKTSKNSYPDYTEVAYALSETYEGEAFFDTFDYFTGYDPTGGFIHYVPREQAQQLNLTYASSETAVLRVDTSVGPGDEPDASTGRFSVRVTSRSTYNKGLFLFDIKHTPYGCGTWPALWLTDPYNWPDHGEMDIMEAVNKADDGNQMTLHTTSGCSMGVKREQTGDALQNSCDHDENENAGCGVKDKSDSFGEAFNGNGGGVMAVEWRDEGIRMWQFPRDTVPGDITSKQPNPAVWGKAAADFPNTDCDIGNHFKNSSIVANIALCGQLVYGLYEESGCPKTCPKLVEEEPNAFETAFWEFGSFQVYQQA
jgi:hypothetical protein